MAFIRNTDKFIEGSKLFFSNERAKAAVQSDLDLLSSEDSAIKLRLDTIEGSGPGSIASAKLEAQAYADQKIAALINSAPEVLDTLKELSDALGGDASFAATVAGQIGAVDAKVDQEILDRQTGDQNVFDFADGLNTQMDIRMVQEVSDRQAADSALSLRLDVLEADPTTKSYVDTAIADVTSAYESNDQELFNRVGGVEDGLSQEVLDREAGDAALQTQLDSATDVSVGDTLVKRNSSGRADISEIWSYDPYSGEGQSSTRYGFMDYTEMGMYDDVSGEQQRITHTSYTFTNNNASTTGIPGSIQLQQNGVPATPASPSDVVVKAYVDAADTILSSRIDALESAPGPDVDKAYVDNQVSGLQGQIDTEKGRIDAILSAADADKDSFAEIVQLINSVDTSNDSAFASYVLSNDAALAQEVSDRQAGDSTLNGKIGSLSALNISVGSGSELNLPFNTKLTVFHPNDVAVFVSHSSQEASTLMAIQSGTNVSFTVESNGQTAVVGPYETVNAPYFNNYHLGQLVNISVLGGTVYEDIRQALSLAVAPYNLFDVNVTKVTIGASIESFASVVEAISYERLQRNGIASQLSQEVSDRQSAVSSLESQVLQLGSDVAYSKLFENVETVSSNMEIDPNSGTQIFFCDVSSVAITLTLPDPSSFAPGRKYVVKDMGSSSPSGNFITVAAQAGQTVDGQSSFEMKMPFEAAQFVSDGSQWFVM